MRNNGHENSANLIDLPYLHEPAILHCLEQRYKSSDIYTYTGPILIAMNPFKLVPLYSNSQIEVYYQSGLLKSQGIETTILPPHIYAIADSAYREMMVTIMGGFSNISTKAISTIGNQAILISGESGLVYLEILMISFHV